MSLHPILSALRKHKSGVVLITLQIAFTLAIVCNALFIIGKRIDTIGRPTGIDESDLFLVQQQWVGAPSESDAKGAQVLDNMQKEDLAALRAMPDVAAVSPTNSLPLFSSAWTGAAGLRPGNGTLDSASAGTAHVVYYFMDDKAFDVLGTRVAAGRPFQPDDVVNVRATDPRRPSVAIIASALQDKLFPGESAIGKVLYLDGATTPVRVIGIVDALQGPSWVKDFEWNTVLLPLRGNGSFTRYAVRAKPGRLEAAMKAVPSALYAVNPMRVLGEDSITPFADIRAKAYEEDVGMAIIMGIVCVILLAVTTAGIVGLTSFWVGQRYRQIGVRRALGARKIDILRHFQMENLVIAGGGACLGIVLAVMLNVVLMHYFDMDRLSMPWIFVGVVVVLLLGQVAVFVPARRASNVPPVAATRAL